MQHWWENPILMGAAHVQLGFVFWAIMHIIYLQRHRSGPETGGILYMEEEIFYPVKPKWVFFFFDSITVLEILPYSPTGPVLKLCKKFHQKWGGGVPRSLTIPPTIQSTTVYSLRNGSACSIK
jgi:hypothetical protein